MLFKQGRYSGFITPISYGLDLLTINLFTTFLPINFQNLYLFHFYISITWIILSFKNEFYVIHRYSKAVVLLRKLFTQFVFFFLILYAYIGFFKQPLMSRLALGQYFILVFVGISFLKLLNFFLLNKYRERIKGNIRNVVVIGKSKKANQLIEVFNTRREFGYHFSSQFSPRDKDFELLNCFRYIVNNNIDEIYCSVSELKKLKFEYYDYLPILSLRDIPLHNSLNAILKRLFDIVFSLVVIFGILIWLGPLLAFLISLESRGPVFFIQKRTGFDNNEFQCFKFRSMAMNDSSDYQQAGKNDMRVTKIGQFIRKTSIDELPQFYNVLFGNMSVVGPRPHMLKHTDEYANRVDKYMLRHFVKPGITGLAQIRGYRGEIERDSDIQNRIKFDIFYVENWSFFLDLKIIVQTIVNALKGEEKAY